MKKIKDNDWHHLTHLREKETGIHCSIYIGEGFYFGGKLKIWVKSFLSSENRVTQIKLSKLSKIGKGLDFLTEKQISNLIVFLIINKPILLKHWKGKKDSIDVIQKLRKIPS